MTQLTYPSIARPCIIEWLQVTQRTAGIEDVDLSCLCLDAYKLVADSGSSVYVAIFAGLNYACQRNSTLSIGWQDIVF